MTQVYFLIPGLILPTHAKDQIDAQTLDLATSLTKGLNGELLTQQLDTGVYTNAVQYVWAWKVITRRPFAPALAPFRWLMDHGPELLSEVWRLHFGHRQDTGCVTDIDSALDEETIERVCRLLTAPLRERGFVLQRWDNRLYATRKSDWGVRVRPWSTYLTASDGDCLIEDLEGGPSERAELAKTQIYELNAILREACIALPDSRSVDTLWISEGGHLQRFYPPTLLRSVLTDDDAILAWAQNAGILDHRTGRVSGATQWPEDAPNGERLAVIDALYEPWLKQDWSTWKAKLPEVIERVRVLAEAAQKKGCDGSLIVGTGAGGTVSIPTKFPSKTFSLLARLTSQKTVPAKTWLFEE